MTSTPSDTPSPPTHSARVPATSPTDHATGPGAPGIESAPEALVWKRGTILRLNREVGFGYVGIESERLSYGFLFGEAIPYRNSRDMKVGDRVAFQVDHSGKKVERLVILPKKPRPKSALRRRVSGWAMTAVGMPRRLWALITEWLRQPKRRSDGPDPL